MRLFLFSILLACATSSATAAADAPSAPVRVVYGGTPLTLENWSILGPFFQTEKQDAWEADFLSQKGAGESDATAKSFLAAAANAPAGQPGAEIKTPHFFAKQPGEFIDFLNLFGLPYIPEAIGPSSAYVACEIQSAGPNQAILMVGSSDAEKIWVNGTLLHDAATRRGVSTYEEALPVTLRAGTNFLLMKVHRWGTFWGLTARLEPTAELAATTALRGQRMTNSLLLKRTVLPFGTPVEIAPRGVPHGTKLPVEIKRADGRVVAAKVVEAKNASWTPELPRESAVYYASLQSGGETFVESFIVGAPAELARALLKRSAAYAGEPKAMRNLEALQRRVRFLTEPEVTKDDRLLIYTLGEMEKTLLLLEKGQEAFRDVPGLHVRAFQSRIDGQSQYYRIYVPSTYKRGAAKLPLVIILPTVTSASRPYIESVFLAGQSEAERMTAIAEKLGLAMLWCGYRNRPTGQPCEFTHLDETLAAVGEDYAIDPRKVSLTGACSGGAIATITVLRWPERFAGVAVFDPTFQLGKNLTPSETVPFFRSPGFRQWVSDNDVVKPYLSEQRTPMYILHDGAEPGHGELPASVSFATEAAKTSYPLKFEQKPRTLHQHFGALEDIFAWLAAQTREAASSQRNPAYFPSEERTGPIANAFADGFVVVTGSGGTAADQAAIARIANEFQDAWRKTHYGPCPVVTDRAFIDRGNYETNAILIGNAETNEVWRKKAAQIPIRLKADSLELKTQRWEGKHLALQAIFPDPELRSRQVVFIGAQDLASVKFGTLDLSAKGWFSFAVWDEQNGKPKLVEANTW